MQAATDQKLAIACIYVVQHLQTCILIHKTHVFSTAVKTALRVGLGTRLLKYSVFHCNHKTAIIFSIS